MDVSSPAGVAHGLARRTPLCSRAPSGRLMRETAKKKRPQKAGALGSCQITSRGEHLTMQTLFTSEQLRRARFQLEWSQEVLAKRARVPVGVVRRLEALNSPLDGAAKIKLIRALQVALEKAGVSLG